MNDDTQPRALSYATGSSVDATPTEVGGLLFAANACVWIGVSIPLVALGGTFWSIFVLSQPNVRESDRISARITLFAGVAIAFGNLVLVVALLLG